MEIKDGCAVVINYKGKLESGEVFDSSEKHEKPLEFVLGQGQVIPGFESAVREMEKGQKKQVEISPEEAYGEINPELVKEMPKSSLPEPQEGQEIKEGMVLMVSTPDGRQFPARITGVSDEEITIDLNHPLAGKKLIFDIEVVDVKDIEDNSEDSE